jgi:hypothetical protein
MRIKSLFALCLLCAGCAGDPFQTFYVPGYQLNAITGKADLFRPSVASRNS